MRIIDHLVPGLPEPREIAALPVYDPATGAVTAQLAVGDGQVVDHAVSRARHAAHLWASQSLASRGRVLTGFRDQLQARRSELVSAIVAENGKVLRDAEGELDRAIESAGYALTIPLHLRGAAQAEVARDVDVVECRQPVGVGVGITPFNFPVMVPVWMMASAIACGNAFVLKPSEKAPSAGLLLGECWSAAGLPEGVFAVVQGDASTAAHLLAHPGVDAVSFIGSTPAAQAVYRGASEAGKRVQALGGAKNHMVVLPDADPEEVADAAVGAAFGAAGQRCMAISVLVAVGGQADTLVERIVDLASRLRVGPGNQSDSDFGPLISEAQRRRVCDLLQDADGAGAVLALDGRKAEVSAEGYFVGPSVVDHVTSSMPIYQQEVFGPVLCVMRVDTPEQALALVNSNPYGNGTAIFTRDGAAARNYARHVSVGMVGINVPIPVPVSSFSFGGWKDSLFGDVHMQGPQGVQFWTRAKVITSRWPSAKPTGGVNLSFPSLP